MDFEGIEVKGYGDVLVFMIRRIESKWKDKKLLILISVFMSVIRECVRESN